MRTTDSLTVPTLICAEIWRRFSRSIRCSPIYSWRYSGQIPEAVVLNPPDLRPADQKLASEFYAGQFTLSQTTVTTLGETPFSVSPPNNEWFSNLHSFQWLRHLSADSTDLIRASGCALITDWINQWGHRFNSKAWSTDVTAARLIAWLSHAQLVKQDIGSQTKQDFLKSLGKHTRYLQRNSAHAKDGGPRLNAYIALAYASLCIAGQEKNISLAATNLDKELDRQIFADGGHTSRNPAQLIDLLANILPLSQAYIERGQTPSPILLSAIERMLGALQFFKHSNGELGQFNGTGFTRAKLLKTIMQFNGPQSEIQKSAIYSGFERLAENNTVVLMDVGGQQFLGTAHRAMAGALSFELSSGNNRFIANCGSPESNYEMYAPYARATAAHSTATVGDTSSSRFAGDSKIHALLPSPLFKSPKTFSIERNDAQSHQTITASHDGYLKKFGIIHTRQLSLTQKGGVLAGIDHFTSNNSKLPPAISTTIRFHLPPNISASPLASGNSVLIASQTGDAWSFNCMDGEIKLEESIQFSGPDHPRKSLQIVVYVNPAENSTIHWSLERRKKQPSSRTRKKNKKNDTPDLLDQLSTSQG